VQPGTGPRLQFILADLERASGGLDLRRNAPPGYERARQSSIGEIDRDGVVKRATPGSAIFGSTSRASTSGCSPRSCGRMRCWACPDVLTMGARCAMPARQATHFVNDFVFRLVADGTCAHEGASGREFDLTRCKATLPELKVTPAATTNMLSHVGQCWWPDLCDLFRSSRFFSSPR